jgi:uncharacterized protein YdcH (DUF465 family)
MSAKANRHRTKRLCPFNNKVPNCTKDKAQNPLGVCNVFHGSEVVTELKDLISIIQQNWPSFEALFHDMDWVRHLIRTIERSRNVIMPSGQLAVDDVERIGMNIRDWIRQVGG